MCAGKKEKEVKKQAAPAVQKSRVQAGKFTYFVYTLVEVFVAVLVPTVVVIHVKGASSLA